MKKFGVSSAMNRPLLGDTAAAAWDPDKDPDKEWGQGWALLMKPGLFILERALQAGDGNDIVW